ncbi:MAG: hypothetical protein MZW92_50410 [Comamonadaceae bacterium]|nr:hypothetical protein [Comamonadaceae bacterium]
MAAVAGRRAPARASCSRSCVIAAARRASPTARRKLFGVSFALGAFFAGMMLRESEFSAPRRRRVAAAARRVRGAVLRLGRHAVRPGGAGRRAAARCWPSSPIIDDRQDRWRRSRWCWPSRYPLGTRADGRRPAWRRSASSRSSSPGSAWRSACCPPRARA